MTYIRPTIAKPTKPHSIQDNFGSYEQIQTRNDPAWITPHLEGLHTDGNFILDQFREVVGQIKSMPGLDELKPEIAEQKRNARLLELRRTFMGWLKTHIEKAKNGAEASSAAILRVTQPEETKDPIKVMQKELRAQEIRALARSMAPELRADWISANRERIEAIVSAPDDIIDSESLIKIRREFAFKIDPSMADEERDSSIIYKNIRKRSGEINATALLILNESGLEDPLPLPEFFETFTPDGTPHERIWAQKTLQNWQRRKDAAERKAEWEKTHPGGLNFQGSEGGNSNEKGNREIIGKLKRVRISKKG